MQRKCLRLAIYTFTTKAQELLYKSTTITRCHPITEENYRILKKKPSRTSFSTNMHTINTCMLLIRGIRLENMQISNQIWLTLAWFLTQLWNPFPTRFPAITRFSLKQKKKQEHWWFFTSKWHLPALISVWNKGSSEFTEYEDAGSREHYSW